VKAYQADMADFATFIEVGTPEAAARVFIEQGQGEANALALEYKADMIERELSPATINRRLASLRSLVKLARTLGLANWNLDVENVKSQSYRDTSGPGRCGIKSILAMAANQGGAKGARDVAVLRLLFDLGLRRGEVVRLDLADVDLEVKTIAVIGKGRRERQTLTLPEATCEALAAWIQERGESDGPLFVNLDHRPKVCGGRLSGTSIYRMVRSLGAGVGISTRPHGLRHTAITEAVKAATAEGIGLEEVLDFSRHADVSTLMIYRDRERNMQGRLAEMVAAKV